MMKPGGCSNNVIRLRKGGTSLPCDSENHPQPFAFHAPHGVNEGFVCSDPLGSAHGVYGWVLACLAVEGAFGALGWWLLA